MNKKFKNISLATLLIGLFAKFTTSVKAEITNPVIGTLGEDSAKAESGETFVTYFVMLWQAIVTIGALAVILYFIWGSFEWITAGGDSGKLEKARNKMMQAVIGLIILVSTFVIVGFISQLLFGNEFNILNLSFTIPGGTK